MNKLAAISVRMPTYEEHRSAALRWLGKVKPTLIDQWPAELAALSIPTNLIKINVENVWSGICDLHDGKGFNAGLQALALSLDRHLGWERKFIRLNSRSPKDGSFPFEVPATMSGKEAVAILCNSMRVMDDLMEFKYLPEQPAYVALRDFDPRITPANEFRCFVKDGKLIAVTHYGYTKPVPDWVKENAREIRGSIDLYFSERVSGTLPIDTVVVDLAMVSGKDFVLIEINPYGLSDPCHFHNYHNVENASSFIEMEAA